MIWYCKRSVVYTVLLQINLMKYVDPLLARRQEVNSGGWCGTGIGNSVQLCLMGSQYVEWGSVGASYWSSSSSSSSSSDDSCDVFSSFFWDKSNKDSQCFSPSTNILRNTNKNDTKKKWQHRSGSGASAVIHMDGESWLDIHLSTPPSPNAHQHPPTSCLKFSFIKTRPVRSVTMGHSP